MSPIRSSLVFAAAALVVSSAAAASADDPEVRRAASLLDYVARGYPTAVADGAVINPAEFEEQQAFAQEAAEMLERLPAGKPFAPEARQLEREIRGKVRGAEARAAALHGRLLEAAGLTTTPPPDLLAMRAPGAYEQACAACHGRDGRGDGFAAAGLPTRPLDFTGPDRDQLTPYRVYTAVRWGVPHTTMPAFEDLNDQRRWEIALWALAFGHDDEDARRGAALAKARGLGARSAELVAKSDAELRELFKDDDNRRALIAWVRRVAPFAPPPAAAFQELRNALAMAAVAYVHGRPQEAQVRLRDAELRGWVPLEPLVRAVAPDRIAGVRTGFAAARARVLEPGGNTLVLGAVAQLAKQIAQAGPEQEPAPSLLRQAGALSALRGGWPAALALGAAVLLLLQAQRRGVALLSALLAVAAAGAGAALHGAWSWQVDLAAQGAGAVALLVAAAVLGRRLLTAGLGAAGAVGSAAAGAAAGFGAVLAAAAAGAATGSSIAAVRSVFPGAPLDLGYAAFACGAALTALAIAAGVGLRALPARAARTAAALAVSCALLGSLASAAGRAEAAHPFLLRGPASRGPASREPDPRGAG